MLAPSHAVSLIFFFEVILLKKRETFLSDPIFNICTLAVSIAEAFLKSFFQNGEFDEPNLFSPTCVPLKLICSYWTKKILKCTVSYYTVYIVSIWMAVRTYAVFGTHEHLVNVIFLSACKLLQNSYLLSSSWEYRVILTISVCHRSLLNKVYFLSLRSECWE